MGKCAVTGKVRPKRAGIETAKQRKARHKKTAANMTVDDLRVVRTRGVKRERAPASQPPKRAAWESRLRSLLKTNQQIKRLLGRDDLDPQQRRKLARRDAVLLEIDAILSEHPTGRRLDGAILLSSSSSKPATPRRASK